MPTLKDAREAAALTQAALADLAGTSQPQIRRLETGERKFTREWAERLAPHLGASAEALLFPTSQPRTEAIPLPIVDPIGARDFPVFSAAEGGSGVMVVSTDPIDIVPRPWFMREVRDGYAVLVVGESMEPVFEPGDMAIVNPRLPVMRGRDAIFTTSEQHGEFRAMIKRLVRWDDDHWYVRQYNEPREFALIREEWPEALRVIGKLTAQ